MVEESEIPYSKAILGAVFIQYFFYALIYIIDGFRFESLYGEDGKGGSAAKNSSPAKSNA